MSESLPLKGSNTLKKDSISFLGLLGLSLAGVLAIIGPIEIAAFIGDTGPAAIWPIILGYLLFVLVSFPIFEYTRIAPFAGGYYGLAELGFGKAFGKFTSLANYAFYDFWQTANAFFISWLAVDTIYILYGVLLPIWAWLLLSFLTIVVTYLMVIQKAENLGKIITYAILITLAIVVAYTLYVIIKSPYNSIYYLNPANSFGGFGGIALATAVLGFYLFTGYGAALFYAEEGVQSRKNMWKAVYIGLTISAFAIALAAYSEVVSVTRSQLPSVGTSSIPQLVTWIHYIPAPALLILNFIILVVSLMAFGAGGGSQARLLWAMTRDNFIKSKWLNELHSRRKVPTRAALFNAIMAGITVSIVATLMVHFYGYTPNTFALSFFVAGTSSTILWYFHHFVPEFGLFAFLRKHKEIKFSTFRKYVGGLVIPIGGMALFIYTFYLGIVSNLVEPYFSFVIASLLIIAGVLIYTVYKSIKGELGESTVNYTVAETGKMDMSSMDKESK
ncbi:MAG: APC family permease [Sulfolobaceae archaeon]